jgi:hypothetical protein
MTIFHKKLPEFFSDSLSLTLSDILSLSLVPRVPLNSNKSSLTIFNGPFSDFLTESAGRFDQPIPV